MATYDDRPISVYDNLHMPTTITTTATINTPKTKAQTTATTATASPTSPPAMVGGSPYADITFKFNDNNNAQHYQQRHQNSQQQQQLPQQQYQQLQQPLSHLIPQNNQTRNQIYNNNAATASTATVSNNPSNSTYATPYKPNVQQLANTTPPTATTASPTLRPLSQHSQSELNEATVQSIAAVKAALHDAKSKFFGLNGYAANNDNNNCNNNQQPQQQQMPQSSYESPLIKQPILYEHITTPPQQRPKVQILTPPPKPTPKYQNIPENSAIFRNQAPPERPPKPSHYKSSNPLDMKDSSMASSPMPGQQPPHNYLDDQQQTPTSSFSSSASPSTSKQQQPSTNSSKSPSPARSLTYNTTYKQIPLNDIDLPTPSQAVYMSTTVPQNIKGSKIAGRHTPTRNSLRHSRMLVINNKNYQVVEHPNPMNFNQPNLARWLTIFQIIIGVLLACLSIWIVFLAPNTVTQDNPYWSGLVLLLAGIFGLILIRYRRIPRRKVRENCFLFVRANSYVLSLAAALLCCIAMIFASIHFARLMAPDTLCLSSNILQAHSTCLCTFNAPPAMLEAFGKANATQENERAAWLGSGVSDETVREKLKDLDDHSYKVEYRDLTCQEIWCEWVILLGISMALNGLGLLVTFIYIVLLACHRYSSKRIYTSVQTSTF